MEELTQHAIRQPLASSLRWLQFCLLLLFGHDVLCFSLGYPFLPGVFGGAATGLAFSSYGLASIATLLLLLVTTTSSSTRSSAPATAATKFKRIVAAAAFAAAAGAANTVLPNSYAVLIFTKAAQGAASALYFCQSLSLVAAVFPPSYRTQAMAFISAGLTVGDALGPVLGGLVYQAAGLQYALGMQPVASTAAVLAWVALLAWPADRRPWHACSSHYHHHQQLQGSSPTQQQERRQIQQQQQQQQCLDRQPQQSNQALGDAASSWDQAEAPTADSTSTRKQSPELLCRNKTTHSDNSSLLQPLLSSSNTADDPLLMPPAQQQQWQQEGHLAAASGLRQLRQLISNPAVASLCLLALAAQAARTAVDLLVPIMLEAQVQPGTIGLLFAGEAVGSVIAPFFVDWLLHKHSCRWDAARLPSQRAASNSNSGNSSSQGVGPAAAAAGATAGGNVQQSGNVVNSDGSSSSSSTRYACWLLLLSTLGMAVCCALVLSAWQLPSMLMHANTEAAQDTSSSADSNRLHQLPYSSSQQHGQPVTPTSSSNSSSTHINDYGFLARAHLWSSWCKSPSVPLDLPESHILPSQVLSQTLAATAVPGPSSLGPEKLAAAAADKMGVTPLLVICLLLLILGSCHSSCETLIYTVLTDYITACEPTAHAGSTLHSSTTDAEDAACLHNSSSCCLTGAAKHQHNVHCLWHHMTDADHPSTSTAWSPSSGMACVTDHTDFAHDHGFGQAACSGATVAGVNAWPLMIHADSGDADIAAAVDDATSISPQSDFIWSYDEYDVQVQVDGEGSASVVSEGQCCILLQSHTPKSALEDCTEVVMVLYVLFWVVGFTMGAAVVGLPNAGSLLQLQGTATALGVLLAAAGAWAWKATA